jgi:hypothetical protein
MTAAPDETQDAEAFREWWAKVEKNTVTVTPLEPWVMERCRQMSQVSWHTAWDAQQQRIDVLERAIEGLMPVAFPHEGYCDREPCTCGREENVAMFRALLAGPEART